MPTEDIFNLFFYKNLVTDPGIQIQKMSQFGSCQDWYRRTAKNIQQLLKELHISEGENNYVMHFATTTSMLGTVTKYLRQNN